MPVICYPTQIITINVKSNLDMKSWTSGRTAAPKCTIVYDLVWSIWPQVLDELLATGTPLSYRAAPAMWKVQMQDALSAGCWPGVHGSRPICLLVVLQTRHCLLPDECCSWSVTASAGGSHLDLPINGPFKAARASHWKGHALTPSPCSHMVVLARNYIWLPV